MSIALDIFGDRWSLLIVRDLMVRGLRTFQDFQHSGEGIASNILAQRLQRLQSANIICAEVEESDRRRVNYRLTEKGIDLAPVLLEILLWSGKHEETAASCNVITNMEKGRASLLREVRKRWRDRDLRPVLPEFS